MRLLFFIDNVRGGGAQRVMAAVVNHYAEKGCDVTLAVASPYESVFELDRRVRVVHLMENDCPLTAGALYIARRNIILLKRIRCCAREIRPDVAISFIITFNYKVILSLLGTGIPVVVCEHSNVTRRYPFKNMLPRRIFYPFSTAVTVLTRRDLALWRRKYSQTVYLSNPCEAVTPSETENRRKVVLSAGNVCTWEIKGFDNLIRCWEKLRGDFPDWKLQIAGKYDDSSLAFLKSLSSDFDNSRIEFLDFRTDVGELMDSAQIYCLSSRVEGLPMALLEAMSRSCCCVAFDCQTGPSEIIRNGFDGLLARDLDVDDLEAKLRLVMENEALRKTLASRANAVQKRYSPDRVFGRWDILFAKICGNNV